jgi:hypothetical protein
MFERALMFFCFILLCQLATAQVCYDYPCVIAKIKRAIEKADYNTAFDNLESASKYRNSNPEEISQLRKLLFDRINQEKIKAQEEEARSRRLLQQVRAESQRAESAEADVDRLAQEKEQQEKLEKLRMENAEIAAHNRKLADRVKENDLSLALNILKYNLDNFPEDELTRAAYNTLSQRVQNEIACIAVSPKIVEGWTQMDYDFGHYNIQSVAISKDGKRCFWASKNQVMLWDVSENKVSVILQDGIVGDIQVDSSGQKLVYLNGDTLLKCINLKTNQRYKIQEATIAQKRHYHGILEHLNDEPLDTTLKFDGSVSGFALESGGNFCIVTTTGWGTYKWDLNENKTYAYQASHFGNVNSISIAKKSPFVLTGGEDGIARLWRTNKVTGTIQAYLGHRHEIYEAALAPDRSICISLSLDRTMKWWDVEQGRVIRSINIETARGVFGLPSHIEFTPKAHIF